MRKAKRIEVDTTKPLMTRREVAEFFRVKERAVSDWAKAGKLRAVATPGGELRFMRSDVERVVSETLIS